MDKKWCQLLHRFTKSYAYTVLDSFKNADDKINFQIHRELGKASPSEAPLFFKEAPSSVNNYFTIDFAKGLEDPANRINLNRIYIALITGSSIRFSKEHTFKKQGTGSQDFIGEINLIELQVTIKNEKELYARLVSKFFSMTNTPKYLDFSSNYWFIPHADTDTFINLLLLYPDLEYKMRMINNFVDFNTLNKIMINNHYWSEFYEKLKEKNMKLNKDLLTLFIKVFVTFKDPNFIYDPSDTPQTFDSNDYDIDYRLSDALYLNRFLIY